MELLSQILRFTITIQITWCVRILELKVPARVKVDDTVELTCIFDLEKESLLSLYWWKGAEQFYLYGSTENTKAKQTIYETPGIVIDRHRSGLNTVVLRNVSRRSSGRYKCEVVAEFPSYERDSKHAVMEVVEVPHRSPVLSLTQLHFNVGDVLDANCSSPGVHPPSKLVWFINGKRVNDQHTRTVTTTYLTNGGLSPTEEAQQMIHVGDMDDLHIMEKDDLPLSPIASNVRIVLRQTHFVNGGRVTLTCASALPGLYYKSTEVQLTLPGVAPVTSSHRMSQGGRLQATAILFISNIIFLQIPLTIIDLSHYSLIFYL